MLVLEIQWGNKTDMESALAEFSREDRYLSNNNTYKYNIATVSHVKKERSYKSQSLRGIDLVREVKEDS